VPLCFGPIWLLPATRLLVKASPLLSRAPITKYIYHRASCKANSSTSTVKKETKKYFDLKNKDQIKCDQDTKAHSLELTRSVFALFRPPLYSRAHAQLTLSGKNAGLNYKPNKVRLGCPYFSKTVLSNL
jgi:hypothetical protein